MSDKISAEFFKDSPLAVARRLLGCRIVRLFEGERLSGRIVEAEAYGDLADPACHVIARDRRIWAMLAGPPGVLYLHRAWRQPLFNVVCAPPGTPGCILVRALEPLEGLTTMRRLRGGAAELTSGPARLVQALAIDPLWEGEALPRADLWLEAGEALAEPAVLNTARIGLRRGTELPWRFAERGNRWVSKSAPKKRRPLKTDASGVDEQVLE